MNATCTYCKQPMDIGAGCTFKQFPGEPERTPHNQDRDCHDCNVSPGQLHHPGCDMERCPMCQGQAISCGCTSEDDE